MSLDIKDGLNAAKILKTTLDAGEHVPHHKLDNLPPGAATEETLAILNAKVVAVNTGAVSLAAVATATYAAFSSAFTPASTATDFFTITGSASKIVRVSRIILSGTRQTATQTQIDVLLRSSANSGGTSAAVTAVPLASANPAATATVRQYTANPTTGTLVGKVASLFTLIPTSGGQGTPLILDFEKLLGQAITLSGTGEVLALNLAGATITSGSLIAGVEWTEAAE